MLTPKQHDLLTYILKTIDKLGVPPSFEEMKEHMNLKSKSGIHRLVSELTEKGYLRHLPNRARAIEVIRLPQDKRPKMKVMPSAANDNVVSLPLYGKIAAGVPIEAVANPETVCIPAQMIGSGEHYALTVEGDSMKDIGIMDGDTVIIRRTKTADNGAIVVALIDGYDVTLKRFYSRGGNIALQPENKNYETRIFPADRVEIQGELVGLMRQY